MTRAILLVTTCVAAVLVVSGCHRDDPTTKAIRASLQGERGKLLRQVYDDGHYHARWIDGRKLNGSGRDLI